MARVVVVEGEGAGGEVPKGEKGGEVKNGVRMVR